LESLLHFPDRKVKDAMTDQPDPREALASIQAARQSVHARIASKGWRYDLAYAATASVMVGTQALTIPFNVLGSTLGVLLLTTLFRQEARRTGLRVTGVSPRRARWVAIGLGLLFLPCMLGLVWAARELSPGHLAQLVAAVMVAVFAVALAGSRLWRRVYRAEMRGQQ
jgi:putative effector of murein hydrolase LrgA (UPF0299 family)